MQNFITWKNIKAPDGYKLICIDQIGAGFIRFLKSLSGSYIILHSVPGETWVTNEGSFQEMKDIYTETLFEELS